MSEPNFEKDLQATREYRQKRDLKAARHYIGTSIIQLDRLEDLLEHDPQDYNPIPDALALTQKIREELVSAFAAAHNSAYTMPQQIP